MDKFSSVTKQEQRKRFIKEIFSLLFFSVPVDVETRHGTGETAPPSGLDSDFRFASLFARQLHPQRQQPAVGDGALQAGRVSAVLPAFPHRGPLRVGGGGGELPLDQATGCRAKGRFLTWTQRGLGPRQDCGQRCPGCPDARRPRRPSTL